MKYLIFLLIFLIGCVDYKEPIREKNWSPIDVGMTIKWQVDSILYSPLRSGGKDTISHIIVEKVIKRDIDGEGDSIFIVSRNNKRGIVKKTEFTYEEIWDNLRQVTLTYPIFKGNKWSGSSYINQDTTYSFYSFWNWKIIETSPLLEIQGVNDTQDYYLRYAKDYWKENVGLIKRIRVDLQYIGPPTTIPWPDKANRGYITIWKK